MPSLRVLHYLLLTTAMVAAQDAHDGHDGMESCACAAGESRHAFTVNCAATAALATAEGTLNSASCEATESSCEAMSDAGGTGTMMMVCQTAYFVLQAHHDFCDHDTLSEAQEGLVHTFEDACHSCTISRPYDSAVRDCVVPANCDDPAPAIAAYTIINATCVEGGACCADTATQAAHALIYEYHELCHEGDLPEFAEHAIHDFEATCESFGECNTPMSAVTGYEPDHCEEEEDHHEEATPAAAAANPAPTATSSALQLQVGAVSFAALMLIQLS